jgi:hypothetical protein
MVGRGGILVADAWVTPGPPPGSHQHLPWSPPRHAHVVAVCRCIDTQL